MFTSPLSFFDFFSFSADRGIVSCSLFSDFTDEELRFGVNFGDTASTYLASSVSESLSGTIRHFGIDFLASCSRFEPKARERDPDAFVL